MKKLWIIVLAVGVLGFSLFVWPTPYSYYEQPVGRDQRLLSRTNRFTARTEFLYPGRGWLLSQVDSRAAQDSISVAQNSHWEREQRMFPDVRVKELWSQVQKDWVAKGFAEPWSDSVVADATNDYRARAADLEGRVNSDSGVTTGETGFLITAPKVIRAAVDFRSIPTPPPGFRLDK